MLALVAALGLLGAARIPAPLPGDRYPRIVRRRGRPGTPRPAPSGIRRGRALLEERLPAVPGAVGLESCSPLRRSASGRFPGAGRAAARPSWPACWGWGPPPPRCRRHGRPGGGRRGARGRRRTRRHSVDPRGGCRLAQRSARGRRPVLASRAGCHRGVRGLLGLLHALPVVVPVTTGVVRTIGDLGLLAVALAAVVTALRRLTDALAGQERYVAGLLEQLAGHERHLGDARACLHDSRALSPACGPPRPPSATSQHPPRPHSAPIWRTRWRWSWQAPAHAAPAGARHGHRLRRPRRGAAPARGEPP